MKFGEDFRGQSGAAYESTNAKKLSASIEFPRLTQAQYDIIEYYSMALPASPYATVEMIDCDRRFDGVTVDSVLNRILNKVKIMSFDAEKQLPYDDSGEGLNIYRATMTVEET